MRKKKLPSKSVDSFSETKFCTECGDDLNDFSLTERAKHVDAVKANFENCKKTGKFKGEECSKLFISSDPEIILPDEDF